MIPDSFLRQEKHPECIMWEKQFQKVYSPKFGGFNGGLNPVVQSQLRKNNTNQTNPR